MNATGRISRIALGVLVIGALVLFAGAPSAGAASPWWSLGSGSWPTNLPASGTGKVIVTAENVGDASIDGSVLPVVLEDTLPEHLEVTGVEPVEGIAGEGPVNAFNRGPVTCSAPTPHSVRCMFDGVLPSYEELEVRIAVKATGASASEANSVVVSGGDANLATVTQPIRVGESNGFGIAGYELLAEEEGGGAATQAGAHPFQLTTVTNLDTSEVASNVREQEPAAMAKDLTFQLPPGLIGNPTPLPQCTDVQFSTVILPSEHNECEAKAAIGVAVVTVNVKGVEGLTSRAVPVFNLTPLAGEPARFGFEVDGSRTFIETSVRSGRDYGVTVTVPNITESVGFLASKVSLWGVPGAAVHDDARGWECVKGQAVGCSADVAEPPPFLSLPTACSGPLDTTVEGDSWAEPHPVDPAAAPLRVGFEMAGFDGCNRLQFDPSIRVAPDVSEASQPSGLSFDLHIPETAALDAEGLAESDMRSFTVALPEGLAINPSGGDGLLGCSEALAGFTGFEELSGSEPGARTATFTPSLADPLQPGVNSCPDASKIASLRITTPLLPNPLEGALYIANQNQNPFGSLLAVYGFAVDPVSGVTIKLAGETRLNAAGHVGEIVFSEESSPQAPFEDAEIHFFGGERAPFATPARCGAYTTTATLAPWSGNAPADVSSTFEITSGPHGTPCPGATLPFSPSLTGGTTNINAGAFSPLVTTIGREDGNQDMQGVQLHMPAGVEGLLAGVKLCPEAQANEGTCGPQSLIGETTVSAGVGSDPATVTGGRVYITESYAGAPFGLSIVDPVKTGPFDLEHDTANPAQDPPCDCIVVRAKIEVDPVTADLTVTTDQSGPHAIPSVIDGIPVQIKQVNVTINREHFTFNPTNCNPLSLTGTLAGTEGASQPLAVPFQATNCGALKFTPTLAVSTTGKASKANGTSLNFKIAYPKAALGSQAWMKLMKFSIPKQLPARLTTIQKACLAATFESDRAACPAASIIGHVIVHTPVLPVPLEGPLYFVSYGGAAFPDAVAVLHGYGLTIESHGHTFIDSKTGVTSATFEAVPDVPFESIEVSVPQGPFSEFGANVPAKDNYNLCGQKLLMPTLFKAQNGLEIHQNTPVTITGCAKTPTNAQKLAAALKACHNKHGHKRVICERAARKTFGVRASRTHKAR
jgi:hypothetical protein